MLKELLQCEYTYIVLYRTHDNANMHTVRAALEYMYFNTLIHLQQAIKSKLPSLLKQNVTFLHENATPHSTKLSQNLLNHLKWDVFQHPAYSPDLAPTDYTLILSVKHDLCGRHFTMEKDLSSMVTEFFTIQDAEQYSAGIRKLISRYNEYLYEQCD